MASHSEGMAYVHDSMDWPLDDLLDGHEFVLSMPPGRRPPLRSRFQSKSGSLGDDHTLST
jgi:hypothetical protein